MHNLFKQIKKVKYHIENLKNQIPYIRNQKKLDMHIAMVNDIIQLINDVEFMVDFKINSNTMDKFILAHMHLLIKTYGYKDGVDIKFVVHEIDNIIKYPRSLQVEYLTDLFNEVELRRIHESIPTQKIGGKWKKFGVTWDKTEIDKTNISDKEVSDVLDRFKNMDTVEDYDKLLTNLLSQFKEHIIWN